MLTLTVVPKMLLMQCVLMGVDRLSCRIFIHCVREGAELGTFVLAQHRRHKLHPKRLVWSKPGLSINYPRHNWIDEQRNMSECTTNR